MALVYDYRPMASPPIQPPRRTYRIRPPELWAAIRADWEAGAMPAELERKYDVPISTTLARAKREDWLRQPPPPEPLRPAASEPIRPLSSPLEVAEAALAAASEALQRGRPSEAMALIKAGDTVGAFADFVQRLRQRPDLENGVFSERRAAEAGDPSAGLGGSRHG